MSDKMKIDISSTAVEKALDGAKAFLDKLIMPAVEETGLLLKDQVASWRLKNQVKILNRAKDICEKNNIKSRSISLKLLCPYLEYASLEEDEYMQDKWANLLASLVDSEQNVENNIFPYILSQISKTEFEKLQSTYDILVNIDVECRDILRERIKLDAILQEEVPHLNVDLDNLDEGVVLNVLNYIRRFIHQDDARGFVVNFFEKKLILLTGVEFVDDGIKPYEMSNLLRLGLVDKHLESKATVKRTHHSRDVYEQLERLRDLKNLEIDLTSKYKYSLTKLAELFMMVCASK